MIKKIKGVDHDFTNSVGPSTTTTLGLEYNGHSYIMGCFYVGPYMNENAEEDMKTLEAMIDEITGKKPEAERCPSCGRVDRIFPCIDPWHDSKDGES